MGYTRSSRLVNINDISFARQADAVLNQANPVSTTLYTVLDTTANVRIIDMMVYVIWTVQPSPLEIVLTIDGQTLTYAQTNPASGSEYEGTKYSQSDPTALTLTAAGGQGIYRSFLAEGRSVKIQARTTGGTVSTLYGRVKYAKR